MLLEAPSPCCSSVETVAVLIVRGVRHSLRPLCGLCCCAPSRYQPTVCNGCTRRSAVSTLKPIVGMVVKTFSLWKTVVFPAASSLTIKIVISVVAIQSLPRSCCVSTCHVIKLGRRLSRKPKRCMRRSNASSYKIFWSSFSSRVTKCLADPSWILPRYSWCSASLWLSACCSDVAQDNMSRNTCN